MKPMFDEMTAQLATLRGADAVAGIMQLAAQVDDLDPSSLPDPVAPDLWLALAQAASDEVDHTHEIHALLDRATVGLPPDPARRALVGLLRGIATFHDGQFQASARHCAGGLLALGTTDIPLLRAKLHAQHAVAARHLGLRDEALGFNLTALAEAGRVQSPEATEIRATLHNNIGVLLLAQGDPDAAIRHLKKALDEASDTPGTDGFRAMVHLNVGRLLLRGNGDPAAASAHLAQGEALARAIGSETMRRRAQESLALARRREGRFDEALALLDPLADAWGRAGAELPLASVLLARGRVRLDLGRDDASDDVHRAFELAEKTASFDLMLEASHALTDLLEARGCFEAACQWHRRRADLEKLQYDREKSARMEEMHARHRVEQAERELHVAKDRAEAASRAKSRFLAITSHELRTPLNAILGYTELLLDDARDGLVPSADALASDLGRIRHATDRLQRLIDRILLLTSLDEGRAALSLGEVEVAAHLEATLQPLAEAAHERGNTLLAELDPSLGAEGPMRSDPNHLAQIVQHLVDNATGFTENGTITVRARRVHDELVLEVADTGVGFDPSTIDELLQPFQQTDMSYTRHHEGLGLGLTLCRHQVDLLGGTLSAEGRPGEGATFRVVLPWCTPSTDAGLRATG